MDCKKTVEIEEQQKDLHEVCKQEEYQGNFAVELLIDQNKLGRILRFKLNLRNEDVFDTPNVIKKLINRKSHVYYGVMTKELPLKIEDTDGKTCLPLITKEEMRRKISSIKCDSARREIGYAHIGGIQVLIKSTFAEGVNSPIQMALLDNRIRDRKDCVLGIARGNLAHKKAIMNVYPKFSLSLNDEHFNKTLSFAYKFNRLNLVQSGGVPFTDKVIITNGYDSLSKELKEKKSFDQGGCSQRMIEINKKLDLVIKKIGDE
ncbi:uncharacterized protein LOC142617042 [Castanea sativa]|uniref:uncharacterized protein LOC142617042 n=1 Tax=Castanea sativa TaxID=21020 RepID=UPI003F64B925